MKKWNIRAVGTGVLILLWAVIVGFAWFSPPKEESWSERRKLKKMPEITMEAILDGTFMSNFDGASLDQFPLRDTFRQAKALFHRYVLVQQDNNEVYYTAGHFNKLDYPVDTDSVNRATGIFNRIYQYNLKDKNCKVYVAAIPDKGYYLGEPNGFPVMDYSAMFTQLQTQLPWATHIDLTDTLTIDSFYKTDTHWRQETLIPTAGKIAQALGVTAPKAEDYTLRTLPEAFYGVYYGQAALPVDAEAITLLESELLKNCKVYNFETQSYGTVYDEAKRQGKDLYEVYLSGPQSLLTIENPNAATDRELVIFRDSFGSSIAPLLVQDYSKVTLIDIRYVPSMSLAHFGIEFEGKDVLFLYSTMVLNDSTTLK